MSYHIYRQPTSLLRDLQQEIFPLANWLNEAQPQTAASEAWVPKVDIKEEEQQFVVYVDVPGVKPENVEVHMDKDMLTVKGYRKTEREEKSKNYYRTERLTGKFYRQFSLPESVNGEEISAKLNQGVLTIHIPKARQGAHTRKIEIEVGDN